MSSVGLRCSAALALCLGACAVGPNFRRPAAPEGERYTRQPTPKDIGEVGAARSQRLQVGADVAAQWWQLFGSPELDRVVDAALRSNQTLLAARQALRAARAAVSAANGGLFPQLDLSAGAARRKGFSLQAGNVGSVYPRARAGAYNLFSLGGTVGYAPDVFGGTRRSIERQAALADNQRYQLAAAYLSVTGNAVTQAITIAAVRAQLRVSEQVIQNDRTSVELVGEEYTAGKVARSDVLVTQTQLASDLAAQPALRQQLSVAQHALAVLTGRAPAAFRAPDFELDKLSLPHALPLSLPSKLARQRPDILAAEAQLHADSAAVGVATAQLYPNLNLSASLSQQAFDLGSLFSSAGRLWSLATSLSAPLFHGGSLRAQRRQAIANFKASLATYQQTVLQGLQQVADTLQALVHDAQLVEAQGQLLDTASETLDLQQTSYREGKTGILNLLDAQRSYQQARSGFVRAQMQRLQDSAQLLIALGGGWWNRKDL